MRKAHVLFGSVLKEKRTAKGLSQTQVADLIGVSNASIANYELGKRSVSFEKALKLALLFQFSLDEIKEKYSYADACGEEMQ